MVEVLGKYYYIDLENITKKCQTGNTILTEDGTETAEINIFKYEIVKVCLERILNEYQEVEEGLGFLEDKVLSVSFKFAFNTLLKYQILIEDEQ
jgi:hypothetical protein